MKAIFNSRVIDTSKPLIFSSNRAFCYGDGLFETIVTGPERIDLTNLHLNRLARGCDVLGMEFPEALNREYLYECIEKLSAENGLSGNIRTKLILWRNEGGLYSPENQSVSFLVECKESQKPIIQELNSVGICEKWHTCHSPISFAKTTNALSYVMAGKEMKEKGWEEIILTDGDGNLSETHISNLFWYSSNAFFTPAISSGCVEGVMRNFIIQKLKSKGFPVKEVLAKPAELKEAECIFSTNASGVSFLNQLFERQNISFSPSRELKNLIKQLLQP